ncbi:MAG TPA: tRNA lysidine(34) synthetase TilS [Tepidisphaeraceae bacterium]|jgi:tRNA(Ile)-lysidine synthetase-like protein
MLDDLPTGKYAVACSGGADSTALVFLLRERRPELELRLVHLNHQLRGEESDVDEEFVRGLAKRFDLPATIARREQLEKRIDNRLRNKSARFRAMRRELFAETVEKHGLDGVILAHHADDQAETILQRLLRGAGVRSLRGMSVRSVQQVAGQRLAIFRPALDMPCAELRNFLIARSETWREDSSNQSNIYLRNRLRKILANNVELKEAMLELGAGSQQLSKWISANSSTLANPFGVSDLWDVPPILAREMAREFLLKSGCPAEELTSDVADRLLQMANDAASEKRKIFPGKVRISRRSGKIHAERPSN